MDDLISRKALLEKIDQQRRTSKTGFPKQSFVVGDAINCIRNAPEVGAEPVRHGRWIWRENGEVSCSECDGLIGVAFADTAYKEAIRDHHFCLYCGAKMDWEGLTMGPERCVCCGAIIPERRQVCPQCEQKNKPDGIAKVETNFYDREEIYENCTVQVLTNTATGEVSVGWWRNGGE